MKLPLAKLWKKEPTPEATPWTAATPRFPVAWGLEGAGAGAFCADRAEVEEVVDERRSVGGGGSSSMGFDFVARIAAMGLNTMSAAAPAMPEYAPRRAELVPVTGSQRVFSMIMGFGACL